VPGCARVHAVHKVLAADLALGLKPICWKYYAGINCQMMWGLLSKCNQGLKVNLADATTWPAAGASIKIITLDSPLARYRPGNDIAAVRGRCGCGDKIKVTKASSWMAVAISSYPQLPLVQAMTYLQICNPSVPAAAAVPRGTALLRLCGIPQRSSAAAPSGSSTGPLPLPAGCGCGAYVAGTTPANIDEIARGVCKKCAISTVKKAIGFCNTGSYVSIGDMYPGYLLALPCISSPTKYHPVFATLMSPGGAAALSAASKPANPFAPFPGSGITKPPSHGTNSGCKRAWFEPTIGPQTGVIHLGSGCEWAADGCSGPTAGLQYQHELTPCCNGHDMCYWCAAQSNGWSGVWGRRICDSQFLNGMLSTCDAHWPNHAWWAWRDAWHRFWCRSTAHIMFEAVWLFTESTQRGLDPRAGHACTWSPDVARAYYSGDKCFTRA
jgi:hypothetical protein